uniref:Uncharacterized protein n=1 Tax=Meloidogyne hapla TaxID=6305 RepID=A0A1I8B9S1_MELHA
MAAAAVVDINNGDINNNNEMNHLNNQQDFHFPIIHTPFDSDLASSLFYWPQILPQTNNSNLESTSATTTSIIPHIYPLQEQSSTNNFSGTFNNVITNYDNFNSFNQQKDTNNFISPSQYNNISSIPSTSTSILSETLQQQKFKTNLVNQQRFNPTISQTCFEHPQTVPTQQNFSQNQNYYNTENSINKTNISSNQNITIENVSTLPSSSNNATTKNTSSFRFLSEVAQTLFGQ